MSAETTPIIAHTENSGEGGVPSNSQSTYTTHNFRTAGDIIESNKAMLSEQWEPLVLWVTNCMNTQHFLSHQKTSSSSVATTGKPEDDPMMGSIFKEFSESYNQANENWGEPASEEVTKVVSVAFKETLSESAFKNLLTKVTLPENCKFAQTKLVNPVDFASVSLSIRSTDIKLQEVQRNISKMTGCFIKLLSHLPNILKTNGNHKDEKLEVIQNILADIKMSGYANQNLVSIKKKFILSDVSSEFKDLAKFAEDTNSHLFGEELEDFLKRPKEGIIVCRHSNQSPPSMLQLSDSSIKPQKTTGQPKDPWLATRALHSHSTTPQAHE